MANLRCRDAQLWRGGEFALRGAAGGLDTEPADAHVNAMRPRLRIAAGSALRVARTAAPLLLSGTGLAQTHLLIEPLIVKDLQGGFVGETGTVWTLAPDCSFTVARQIGATTAEPHKRGQLTPAQQRRLRELIDRIGAAGRPPRAGGAPQVNARRITVTYGKTVAALTLPPAGGDRGPSSAPADDKPAAGLLDLAAAIREMTGE